MKICITGSHSVGKTTLAKAISHRLELPMIREVAREVIKHAGFTSTTEYIQNADKHTKQAIQEEIFIAQLKEENKLKESGFVADRSIFDPIAYSYVYGISEEAIYKMIGTAITHALSVYDLLVYVPPMFGPVSDGFRDTSEDIRMAVDECLTRYVEAYHNLGGTVLLIDTQTVEERVEQIISALKNIQISFRVDEEGQGAFKLSNEDEEFARKNIRRGDVNEQTTLFDLGAGNKSSAAR